MRLSEVASNVYDLPATRPEEQCTRTVRRSRVGPVVSRSRLGETRWRVKIRRRRLLLFLLLFISAAPHRRRRWRGSRRTRHVAYESKYLWWTSHRDDPDERQALQTQKLTTRAAAFFFFSFFRSHRVRSRVVLAEYCFPNGPPSPPCAPQIVRASDAEPYA